MDSSTTSASVKPRVVQLGDVVLYHAQGQPVRAFQVGHVCRDGRTVHGVVLFEGQGELSENPTPDERAHVQRVREQWAAGGVFRVRQDVPFGDDVVPATAARYWTHRS